MRFGFSFQDAELLTSTASSQQAIDWVQNNGKSFVAGDFAVGTRIRSLELMGGLQARAVDSLFESGSRQWNLGPALTLPLFDGHQRRAARQARRHRSSA